MQKADSCDAERERRADQVIDPTAALALVFEHAGVGLGVFDRNFRCVAANNRLAEINGQTVETYVGKSIREIIPDVGEQVEAALRAVIDDGEFIENIEIKGDAAVVPAAKRTWLGSYYPNRNARGDIIGVLSVVREVTEELRVESALAESNSRLEMAMSGSGLGVWDWSVDTNSVWFSNTWQTMLGYEPGEVEQHISTWQNGVHPDDWAMINATLSPHLEGLTPQYECEHRVRCKDGSWLWILDRGKVVNRAPDGRALRMVGTHDNIQQRKMGELYRAALLQLSRELTELDSVSRIIDRSLRAILDTLEVDFAGYTEVFDDGAHPRMVRRWRDGRAASSQGEWLGARSYKELANRLFRGETVAVPDLWQEAFTDVSAPDADLEGQDLRALLVVPILRHNKLVGTMFAASLTPNGWDDRRAEFLADLRDRTREAIARAKAGEANRQAQEELQRVGRLNALAALASTLAHELNQPLAAANNYLMVARMQAKRLSDEAGDEDIAAPLEAIDLAAKQVVKAGEIIRQMRAYTESGEVMARPRSITASIDAALETTLASMAPRALSIRKMYAAELPEVMLDDVQFQQVISNLVRNAIEAMDGQDRPELDIGVERAGDRVVVDVSDNGPGLSAAALETLFQPFRSEKRRGLGLGLPICRTIIEAHGGKMTGEQRAKGGARFRVVLPVAGSPLSR